MSNHKTQLYTIYIISFLISILLTSSLTAQILSETTTDSLYKEIRSIDNADIPILAAEVVAKYNRIYISLINDNQIIKWEDRIDSTLNYNDSLLLNDKKAKLNTSNIRNLNNKLVKWKQTAEELDKKKLNILNSSKEIERAKSKTTKEIAVWNNTLTTLTENNSSNKQIIRIKEVIQQLTKNEKLIQHKANQLNRMLYKTSELSISIDEHISVIDKSIVSKKNNLFALQQESIFSFNLSDKNIWSIKKPLRDFYYLEIKQLTNYLNKNINKIVFLTIVLLILIVSFKKIKKSFSSGLIQGNLHYQILLNKILSKNYSAAILLGLLLSIVIFTNRPELFKDLAILFILPPFILISKKVLEARFHFLLYLLALVMLIKTVEFIFPPTHIFYRTGLTAVSIIEILAFWKLINYFLKHNFAKDFIKKGIIAYTLIQMGFAISGLLGVVFGATILAEQMLDIPVLSAFFGILIILTSFIINGLIQIGFDHPSFKKISVIRLFGNDLQKKIILLINITAITLWLFTILKLLNINRIIWEYIGGVFSYEMNIGVISFSLGGIIIFFTIIWLSIVISKFVNIVLEKDILDKFNLAKGVPHTIAMLARYTLITLGVVLAVGAAGLPLQNFTILFGAFGVGIGFGLQNIFNNLVSGLILLFERPIQIGDTVEVGELIGNVKSIGIRSSNIRTFDGAEVIVPNGQLISNEVVNWTLSDQQRRIEVIAGVAYGTDPHKVREILSKQLAKHPDIIKKPEPVVLFNQMGESSLDFRLLFWTSNIGEWLRIQSEVTFMVHDALVLEGIEIPFPQRDLHIKTIDGEVKISKKD